MRTIRLSMFVATALVVVLCARAGADTVMYNDCVHGGSPANTTIYSAYMGDGGGFEDPDGYLKDFSSGAYTTIWVDMSGSNISGSISGAPNAGTDAYDVFNGKVSLGDWSTSYNSSSSGWYYQVDFSGLDPDKYYEFVTTGNRNSASYAGDGTSSRWTQFSVSEEFVYLDDETVAEGFRSTYYENLRSSRDRIRFYPMIDRFIQQDAVMTVFIPYYPLRDNLVMDTTCDPDSSGLDCLRRLWQVSLGDRNLPPDELIPAQRFDLNLRGLIGVIPLDGLTPGRHTLELRWNAEGDASQLDDRYEFEELSYRIPFVFAPAYEMGLEPREAASDEATP